MSFTISCQKFIPPIRGAEHLSKYWHKFGQIYRPTWRIDHAIASGDEVVSEWSCTYTLPSTGNRLIFRGTEWYVVRKERIERDVGCGRERGVRAAERLGEDAIRGELRSLNVDDDEELDEAEERAGVTVAGVILVLNDLLDRPARVDAEGFEFNLNGGDADPAGGLRRSDPCVPLVPASPRRIKRCLGYPAVTDWM